MFKKTLLAIASAGAFAVPHAAFAETATGQLDVSLHVVAACQLALGTDASGDGHGVLQFGTVTNYGGGHTDAPDNTMSQQVGTGNTAGGAGTFTVNCGPGGDLTPKVTIDGGQNADEDNQRFLSNGTKTIAYELYQDDAKGDPWDPTKSTDVTIDDDTGQAAVPIYGVIDDVSNAADGDYTDQVTVTLTY